jgi:hypothetical protein
MSLIYIKAGTSTLKESF